MSVSAHGFNRLSNSPVPSQHFGIASARRYARFDSRTLDTFSGRTRCVQPNRGNGVARPRVGASCDDGTQRATRARHELSWRTSEGMRQTNLATVLLANRAHVLWAFERALARPKRGARHLRTHRSGVALDTPPATGLLASVSAPRQAKSQPIRLVLMRSAVLHRDNVPTLLRTASRQRFMLAPLCVCRGVPPPSSERHQGEKQGVAPLVMPGPPHAHERRAFASTHKHGRRRSCVRR